ncbi:DUF6708 domain-containing protein [Pseudomonas sp. R5(2019)]|uniref:DUF6708 domain-containing protein n=1 Tax=Pseudomonas sp. R5(2019) TaxID=2697566 RepID=UPI001411C2CB|nr:DUF6708 domain-containing protein [Pseudomonas sp. R5(2019)]NBA98534.1 hypothetical protein [Pseudomonas sp. R5(2019)]
MAIAWMFLPQTKNVFGPAIRDQYVSMNREILCLRNPWIADSVFMGKMYAASNCLMFFFFTWQFALLLNEPGQSLGFDLFLWVYLGCTTAFTAFIGALIWYRIFFIKRLSHLYFNRQTQKVYYQRNKTLIAFDWAQTEGGLYPRTEFGGSSFSISYALAFGPKPADGNEKNRITLWVDSNEPTESDLRHVAEVWEYIRQFMAHGPDKLPPPGEPNWWRIPLHRICLSPAEAWRHYAPWRTGEPGELQGKNNWMLPFWLVLFPYNLFSALCWCVVCRVFNVRTAEPPVEALESQKSLMDTSKD